MTIYTNAEITTDPSGKIFNPVTSRYIANNQRNLDSIRNQIIKHNAKQPTTTTTTEATTAEATTTTTEATTAEATTAEATTTTTEATTTETQNKDSIINDTVTSLKNHLFNMECIKDAKGGIKTTKNKLIVDFDTIKKLLLTLQNDINNDTTPTKTKYTNRFNNIFDRIKTLQKKAKPLMIRLGYDTTVLIFKEVSLLGGIYNILHNQLLKFPRHATEEAYKKEAEDRAAAEIQNKKDREAAIIHNREAEKYNAVIKKFRKISDDIIAEQLKEDLAKDSGDVRGVQSVTLTRLEISSYSVRVNAAILKSCVNDYERGIYEKTYKRH